MSTAGGPGSAANGAPLSPQTSYSASKSAMAAIFGPDHKYSKDSAAAEQKAAAAQSQSSKAEPPSGIKGKGTVDEPYDQGNKPANISATAEAAAAKAQSSSSKVEPPSGIKGKGTVDEPYDQGNAPANVPAAPGQPGQEPLSGVQGKGTKDEPYDQGNAGGEFVRSFLVLSIYCFFIPGILSLPLCNSPHNLFLQPNPN